MIVLRAAFIVIGTVSVILMMAIMVMVGVAFLAKPEFDRTHPDYGHFTERFSEARRAFASGADKVMVDFSSLDGGRWRTACLFGGYTHPVAHLESLGAVISPADHARLVAALLPRLASVEEFEVLIAYIDEAGRAHFIHFDEGVGAEGQHYEACVTKPETLVRIDGWK